MLKLIVLKRKLELSLVIYLMNSISLSLVDNFMIKNYPIKNEIIGLASIAVPPTDPLEQYLLDHENDMHMNERNEIDELFFKQAPILKHNLPAETLGDPLPPKSDPVFELTK